MTSEDLKEIVEIIQEYRAGVIRRARGYSKLYLRATKLIDSLKERGMEIGEAKLPRNNDFTYARKLNATRLRKGNK